MPIFATTVLLLAAAKPTPQPISNPLPNTPSALPQQQQPITASSAPNHPRPNSQWLKVESLQPSDSIAVLEPGRRFPIPCRFDDVTDDTLTCTVYPLHTAPRRTVYPIHNIEAVYIEEWTNSSSPTVPLIIGGALGGFIGGGICKEGSAGAIAGCVIAGIGIGALAGIAAAASPSPTPPHLHRQLIYQAP